MRSGTDRSAARERGSEDGLDRGRERASRSGGGGGKEDVRRDMFTRVMGRVSAAFYPKFSSAEIIAARAARPFGLTRAFDTKFSLRDTRQTHLFYFILSEICIIIVAAC